MTESRDNTRAIRWVIKIGSALISNNGLDLAEESLDLWVPQICALLDRGDKVVLVSSGAVSEGIKRLGWSQRPKDMHQLQAAAAVGQAGLVEAYESRFNKCNVLTAQILLVRADLASRDRYLNARHTLQALINLNVVPIVNENDTIATDEIRFGDNDTLAGLVANLMDADNLLILTDQNGVYSDDPRKNPRASLITQCDVHDKALDAAAQGSGNAQGRGGMITKVRAARLASRSGTVTTIANGKIDDVILKIANGEALGSTLTTKRKPITARKQWLAGSLRANGTLTVDAGAVKALRSAASSLLPVGITEVSGNFSRGDLVSCVDSFGNEVARGLCGYNTSDAKKIAGVASDKISEVLGYQGDSEMIHLDDLVIL